MIATSLDS